MSTDAPRSAELLAARGFDVIRVPMAGFAKLEAASTCLSVWIRR